MSYKFQKLKVYQIALDYLNKIYLCSSKLPEEEKFNLKNQIERASTSIVLNIAEGPTGQTDLEQKRFLRFAISSYLETIACFDIMERRGYLRNDELNELREFGHKLFVKLQAFRKPI